MCQQPWNPQVLLVMLTVHFTCMSRVSIGGSFEQGSDAQPLCACPAFSTLFSFVLCFEQDSDSGLVLVVIAVEYQNLSLWPPRSFHSYCSEGNRQSESLNLTDL